MRMIVLPCDLDLLTVFKKVWQTVPYENTEGQSVNNYVVHKYAVSEHRKITLLKNKVTDWPPNNYKTARTFLKFSAPPHSKYKLIVRNEVKRITVTYDS